MAPPRKRRRLSPSLSLTPEMALFEPMPPSTHTVSDLEHKTEPTGVQSVPKRTDEVRFHMQERSLEVNGNGHAVLQRRQIPYPVTTVDANGNTFVSTVTAGFRAGAATSVFPTTTPATSTASPADTSWGDTGTSSTQRSTGSSGGTGTGTVSVAAVSTNAASSGSGSTRKSVYVATLTNGNVRTITRSARPYATTFGDGQVSTICGRTGQCRLSPSSNKSTTQLNSQSSSSAAAGGTASGASRNQSNNNNGGGSMSLATIAGSIIGGAAALALILILTLVWLRWLKRRRRQGHQQLDRSSSPTPEFEHQSSEAPPDMAENARLTPVVGAAPLFFQQENKSADDSERGFSRVSGRKLPSLFSEGAVAAAAVAAASPSQRDTNTPPPAMPLTGEKELRGRSFQGDTSTFRSEEDDGTQYEQSVSPEPSSQASDTAPAAMTLSAGPERRPTIHEPGPYLIEPSTSSTNTPVREAVRDSGALSPESIERSGTPTLWRSETPTLGRSDTPSTIGDNRSSRFTEDF